MIEVDQGEFDDPRRGGPDSATFTMPTRENSAILPLPRRLRDKTIGRMLLRACPSTCRREATTQLQGRPNARYPDSAFCEWTGV